MDRPEEESVPVLIIGAGPTGLTAAIELARRGIGCRVLDRAKGPREWARATIVHGRTLEIFESLGIAETELERGIRSHGINFFSRGSRVGRMDFSTAGTRYNFELMISEEETEAILRDRLAAEGVEVEWDRSFVDFARDVHGSRCQFQRGDGTLETFGARWMLGCDGYQSATRSLLGETFAGKDYEHEWAVLDCHLEGWPHASDEVAVFFEHDALAFLPLPRDTWRVYFRPTSHTSDLLADVQRGIDQHLPGVVLKNPQETARFKTSNRIVNRYRHGTVFLVGDAAHSCSPIEGHGMNTGIQDAHNLAWKLALVESGVCSDILLDSYDIERRPVANAIRKSGDEAEASQHSQGRDAIAERNAELAGIDRDPQASRHRAEAMCEILATYRDSPVVTGDRAPHPRTPSPGERLPDAGFVIAPDGRTLGLHELCHRPTHTVLCIVRGGLAGDDYQERLRKVEDAAGAAGDLVDACFVVSDQPAPNEAVAAGWFRTEGAMAFAALGVSSEAILVVRPDRFVAFRANSLDADRLGSYLTALRGGRGI